MKKLFYFVAAVCATALVACGPNPPKPPVEEPLEVSHEVMNRNVVIEEYTGINCGYCPDGHQKVNEIMTANPGRAFGINIHCGNYASNTYTTEFGNALLNQADVNGFPAGTVNRELFSKYSQKGGTAVDRGGFKKAAAIVLEEVSPLNLAARATINTATRHLKVEVAGYYTADAISEAENGTNMLNIAILQDNVIGKQSNYGDYNEEYITEDGKYRHMHMLRHLITGQWGDAVSPITAGSEFNKTYEYDIPAQLGDKKPIDAVLEDLHLVVFVAQGHQYIITACECPITYVNE